MFQSVHYHLHLGHFFHPVDLHYIEYNSHPA